MRVARRYVARVAGEGSDVQRCVSRDGSGYGTVQQKRTRCVSRVGIADEGARSVMLCKIVNILTTKFAADDLNRRCHKLLP